MPKTLTSAQKNPISAIRKLLIQTSKKPLIQPANPYFRPLSPKDIFQTSQNPNSNLNSRWFQTLIQPQISDPKNPT
jgi:hypothetical protein